VFGIFMLPQTTRPDLAKKWGAYVIFAIAVSSASGQVLRSARAVKGLTEKFPTLDRRGIIPLYISAPNARDDDARRRTVRDDEELIC
jgi:hypothetical protein